MAFFVEISFVCVDIKGVMERYVEYIISANGISSLGESNISYENALLKTGLKTLKQRREEKCLAFSLKLEATFPLQ